MKMRNKNIIHAVLVRFWQSFVLFLCCTLTAAQNTNGECSFHVLQQMTRSLVCSVNKLDRHFEVANLSLVQAESIGQLTINCNDSSHASVVTANTFRYLFHVTQLAVVHCKISELSQSDFMHFRNLQNLTLRTHNNHYANKSLSLLSPQVFRPLEQLETLDLSTNNIWEIPGGAFCPLSNLKFLNLSSNHLQDLTQIRFSSTLNRSDACKSELTRLDLSHNDADVLVSGAFKGLRRLEELLLHGNNIGKVDDEALQGLSSLTTLDLSDNRLVALPENAFMHTPQLMYFRVRNNSLTVLAPGLFRGLQYLVELDLSDNELKSQWLNETSFQGLIRLRFLNLSKNKISHLNPEVFRDMYGVQELRLSHNQIQTLPDSSFKPCINLHTLDLSYNSIKSIPNKAFDGVTVLSFLSIDNNQIDHLGEDAFKNLTSLQDLNVNGNLLKSVPRAISHLRHLKTLDLGDNKISNLDDLPVKGLPFLYGLRLVNNRISGNISRDTFKGIRSLKILNLAKNRISFIESGAFGENRKLQAIRLDANSLTSMNGLFSHLPHLQWLNVSDNRIAFFDYAYLPSSLLWLDLHKNQIQQLGNGQGRHDLRLQTLDASFNRIEYISSTQIPQSVQLLFLNDNDISKVEPFTFVKKENLTRVDLFANKLTKMDFQALRLSHVSTEKALPQFYLGGNSFLCDCTMEWLQRINTFDSRDYPTIMDLDSVFCKMPFLHGGIYLPLDQVKPSHFICQYESHCFALCHCCEFDACDCEMTCPSGCSCFHDQSWGSNIVNCSSNDFSLVPDRIPMDASQVYLDGNDFKNLSSYSFIGRKRLQTLWVNSSQVTTIGNGTFSGLSQITVLHLENNLLQRLHGHEFQYLTLLRELYLHGNDLYYIDQHTFASMSDLEVLTLHDNRLVNFPVWRMVDNPYLMKISLHGNQWTCECQFVESFEIWITDNARRVSNSDEIECVSTGDRKRSTFLVDFNSTNCLNSSSTSTVIQSMVLLDNLLHPAIAVCVVFVFIVVLVVCFLYRVSIREWAYSRCGVPVCCHENSVDESDKIYDVFVSYSSKDEAWVNQVLANELEHRGERQYRVCLHYRDFPLTHYVTETIVDAVDASKRTIIVLSKNFIDNEWCRFQFKSAHHQVLKDKHKRLIVLVIDDIPTRDLDADLRFYLKSCTCIKSNDKRFFKKLRDAMPSTSVTQKVVHTYSTIPERYAATKYNAHNPTTIHHNNVNTSDAYWA